MAFKKNDIRFVINTAVFALLVLAIMHAFKPYLLPKDPASPQAMSYAAEISLIGTPEVPALLKREEGKPMMLVVFASWCGYCRLQMPDIITLKREGKLDKLDFVLLSRDRSLMDLANYMVKSGFYKDFKPYLVKDSLFDSSLTQVLYESGSGYQGNIPYIELFDGTGKSMGRIPYNTPREKIIAMVEAL